MFDVFAPGSVIYKKINTNSLATGAGITVSSLTVACYKDNSTTETTTGVSATADFDSRTGLVHITIDTSTDTSFYSVGGTFAIIATGGTVDGQSVNGKVLYEFAISHLPTAAATIIGGTVTTGASTTSIPTSAIGVAPSTADQYKGRLIIFTRFTTTTGLRGQVCEITASTNASLPTFTVTALTATPASGDTFIIV